MAINEACQVWIEQRIKEELEGGGDKSLREIGRVIAAEIEKVFEAKVNPGTILTKVAREAKRTVSNETLAENQEPPTVKAGDSGDNGADQVRRTTETNRRAEVLTHQDTP